MSSSRAAGERAGTGRRRAARLDAAGISTGVAGADDMVIDDMTLRGGRCRGVAIVGRT